MWNGHNFVRIWTQIAESTSYDNNRYAMGVLLLFVTKPHWINTILGYVTISFNLRDNSQELNCVLDEQYLIKIKFLQEKVKFGS